MLWNYFWSLTDNVCLIFSYSTVDDEDELLYGDSETSVFDSSVNTSMKEDTKAG